MDSGSGADEAIIVPAIEAPSSVVFMRSLGRRGVRVVGVSENERATAFASRYCDEAFLVPSPDENLARYKEALLRLARRDDVRTIVPLREQDTYVLSRFQSEFEPHVTRVWPSFESLRRVQDRVELAAVAEAADVPMPTTELLGEISDWSGDRIVKSRYALLTDEYLDSFPPGRSDEVSITDHLSPGVEPDVESIVAEMGHVPIAQEFIPGDEYAVWALYDHGDAVAVCSRRRIRGFKYTGGASVCRQLMHDPALDALTRSLLDELEWHGPASVQFMKDEDTGEYELMEINPRFWASISCAVAGGVDFPWYYWKLAGDEPYTADPDPEIDTMTHLFRGEIAYLYSILTEESPYVERPSLAGETRAVAESIVDHPHFDFLSLRDPRPFGRDLLNVTANLL